MPNTIIIDSNIPVPMRDGVVLHADVFRPDDNQKHPAILMRCPYDRKMRTDSSYLGFYEAVLEGYAIVIQNVRGTYDSEGKYDGGDIYATVEGPDGYDSVECVASQPWCDGNVGTAGASYLGFLQWMLAKENPPHLKAMAPWSCGIGQLETTLLTGATEVAGMITWIGTMAIDITNKLEEQGKDVSQMRKLLDKISSNPEEVYNFLPLKDVPQFNFEGVREIWYNRALNPIPPTPEMAEKGRPSYNKIIVPCMHVSGWYDFYTWGTFHNFHSIKEKGGSELARKSQHILVGPWGHLGPVSSMGAFGGIDFGNLAGTRGAQLSRYNIAFFNKYLRGMDVGLPTIRYFIMGKNIWRNADSWPLPQTEWQRFFLHSQGQANTGHGNGLLNRTEPVSEPYDMFIYNPYFPVPTISRRGHEASGIVVSPQDHSRVELRDDVLCYTTPELQDDMEVTGSLALHLWAASSTRDTDFVARICDVYPDGRSYNVAEGIIRARFRNSAFKQEPLTPGAIYEFVINMGNSSQLYKKGHRIRLQITSSNFPEYERNMNTGNPAGSDKVGIPALQGIYHDSNYASYIDMPVITSI